MTSLRFQASALVALLLSPGCFDLRGAAEETGGTEASSDAGFGDSGGLSCDPSTFTSSCAEGRVIECTDEGEVRS